MKRFWSRMQGSTLCPACVWSVSFRVHSAVDWQRQEMARQCSDCSVIIISDASRACHSALACRRRRWSYIHCQQSTTRRPSQRRSTTS